jgi:hypothetical protein
MVVFVSRRDLLWVLQHVYIVKKRKNFLLSVN